MDTWFATSDPVQVHRERTYTKARESEWSEICHDLLSEFVGLLIKAIYM